MIVRVYPKSMKLISQAGKIRVNSKRMDREEYHELKLFIEREGKEIRKDHSLVVQEFNGVIFRGSIYRSRMRWKSSGRLL